MTDIFILDGYKRIENSWLIKHFEVVNKHFLVEGSLKRDKNDFILKKYFSVEFETVEKNVKMYVEEEDIEKLSKIFEEMFA
jgi:hypothetical protein